MDRNEARKAAEVMLAYADGKEVEFLSECGWRVTTTPSFNWDDDANYYRIKPQPKYRPFKDAEECWQEMQKHQPFGWVKGQHECSFKTFGYFWDKTNYKDEFKNYTFADGQPFGIIDN